MATSSEHKIRIRNALKGDDAALGAWLTIPSTAVARQISQTPGLSWILIDAEHGLINDTHFYDLCNAVASQGLSPIIRLPIDQDWWIKRALDAGAHGIMVPMAHTADIVRKVVSFAKYPASGGVRGLGPFYTHAAGAINADYVKFADREVLVLCQIESRAGVENIEEIMQVEGLDSAFIGPFDLALSLGVPVGGEAHQAAVLKVLEASKKVGKPASIYCVGGEDAARRREEGFKIISVGVDISTLAAGIKDHVEKTLATAKPATSQPTGYGGS